ncbi:MAG: ComEC/Rec2 family competence protein [Candidatus Omnitrophica bacterium]|nr:ComEC/Rec2 family competence protein [Candidatus Omnitrophota bacterium]MDD5661812.1 ComEC/Rec2 family competence protein [Candidatus Omnitrophota bacterium]
MKFNLTELGLYFCGGIVFTHFIRISFWPAYFLAFTLLLACVFLVRKDFIFKILFAALIFILGCLLLKNTYILPQSHISRFIFYKNNFVYTARGFINSQPYSKEGRISFMFTTQELQFNNSNYRCSGDILVQLKDNRVFSYGEALILRGSIHRPFKLYGKNVSAIMRVSISSSAVKLAKNYGQPARKIAFYLKNRIEGIIYRKLAPLTASILDAMVLGEKRGIPAQVYDAMVKSGTVHILVVSGFNVGIVAFMIMLLLKVLRLTRVLRYITAIPCLVIYCLATGASPPVVRATVMAIFFLTGFLFRREPDVRNSLALSALFILWINPRELFSISFQLSYASVAAIIFLYPQLKAFFKAETIKIRPLRFIAEGCLVSLSAWLGTCGFILYYFKIFSPVTVLANICIVPLATLITLSGFSLVIITLVFPALAGPFAWANELFVVLLLKTNNFFIHLPYACLYL